MSRIITINIPRFYFSGNAAELKFMKQGILEQKSGYPYLLLCFDITAPPSDGEILELVFGNGKTISFAFKDASTFDGDNPEHIPATLPIDFGITSAIIAAHILRHPYIRANYACQFVSYDAIMSGKSIIELRAIKRGLDYNVSLGPGTTVYTDATYTVTGSVANNDVPYENYKLKASVNVTRDMLFNPNVLRIANLEATGLIDADNDLMEITFYELPEIARTSLGVDIPYNAFLPQLMRYMFVMLSIEVNEEYNGVGKKSKLSALNDIGTDTSYRAALGGFPLSKGDYERAFYEWAQLTTPGQKKFATYQARTKLITREQPEFLALYVAAVGTATVNITIYYDDQSTVSTGTTFDNIGAYWLIPSGFDQNNLPYNNATAKAVKYTFLVVEADGFASETFTYILDPRYFEHQRYFIFQNSLAGIDTLRSYGVNSYTVKRKSDTVLNTINSKTNLATGSIEMVYNQMEQTYTMRTGWLLNKEEKEYLLELLYSKYVAEVPLPLINQYYIAGRYHMQPYEKCIVQVDSIEMWEESDGMWAMEWKMKRAHDDINYSNAPAPLEMWYDSVFEFTILIESDDAGTIGIFTATSYMDVWVDGVPGTGGLAVDAGSNGRLLHITVKGYHVNDLTVEAFFISGSITFTKIETCWLQQLSILGFNINGNYLYERIPSLYKLGFITIWPVTDGPAGMDISQMFARVSALYNQYTALNTIDFSTSTPTGAAPLIKDSLVNAGLTVNTL